MSMTVCAKLVIMRTKTIVWVVIWFSPCTSASSQCLRLSN